MSSQRAAIDAALVSANKATDKAEEYARDKFESMNEIRGSLSDAQAHFTTRAEFNSELERAREQLREVMIRLQESVSRTEMQARYDDINKQLGIINDRLAATSGKSVGLNAGWGYIGTAIAIIASAIATYFIIQHGGTPVH